MISNTVPFKCCICAVCISEGPKYTHNDNIPGMRVRPIPGTPGDFRGPGKDQKTRTHTFNCSLRRSNLESRIHPFHLDTLRVAESVPHLGPPVRGPIRRNALRKSKVAPGAPIPALLGPTWGVLAQPGGGRKIRIQNVHSNAKYLDLLSIGQLRFRLN